MCVPRCWPYYIRQKRADTAAAWRTKNKKNKKIKKRTTMYVCSLLLALLYTSPLHSRVYSRVPVYMYVCVCVRVVLCYISVRFLSRS